MKGHAQAAAERQQLHQLQLFDGLPSGVVDTESGWRSHCPHCGGSVDREPDETLEQFLADPACALCRAEFYELPFREWRALPQTVKEARRPPVEWRSIRYGDRS